MTFRKTMASVLSLLTGFFALSVFSCTANKEYHVGDIVLSDGTVVNKETFSSYNGKAKPVAVIFSINGAESEISERVLGVALDDAGSSLAVCTVETGVLSQNFHTNATLVKNQVYYSASELYGNEGFTGNLDGRKVFYSFTEDDLKAFNDEKLFPAYNASLDFGKDKDFGKFTKGWYFPSIAELYELYETSKTVNESILAAGGKAVKKAKYWTSSSAYDATGNTYSLNFENGNVSADNRQNQNHVRAIYCFSEGSKESQKKNYSLGDIVMDDGSVLTPLQIEDYTGSAKPMAIIFSTRGGHFEESNRVLGVGLNYSELPLAFAPKGTLGHRTNMLANQSILTGKNYSIKKHKYSNNGFMGLLDGRNTWKNISYYDSESKSSSKNYPAFDYAVKYGKANGLKKYEKGWYLPTAAEAYELSEVIDIVNFSIGKCGAKTFNHVVWTSSQDYGAKNQQYIVDLRDRDVDISFKENEYTVCAVYCFE